MSKAPGIIYVDEESVLHMSENRNNFEIEYIRKDISDTEKRELKKRIKVSNEMDADIKIRFMVLEKKNNELLKHAVHLYDCKVDGESKCTCGLDELLDKSR